MVRRPLIAATGVLVLVLVLVAYPSRTNIASENAAGPAVAADETPTVTIVVDLSELASPPETAPAVKQELTVELAVDQPPHVYVAPDGNDANSGTSPSEPLQTVAEAARRLDGTGGTVELAAGSYPSQTVSGVKGKTWRPIVVRSPDGQAVLSTGKYDGGVAISVVNSQYIVIEGLVAQHSLWGVQVDASSNITLLNNTVTDIGQEAIHIGYSNSVQVVENTISHTGRRPGTTNDGRPFSMFGEGIYVGCSCRGDTTNDIRISHNHISFTTAEAIDLKPETFDLLVEGNRIHDIDTANSGAVVLGIGVRNYDDPNAVIRNNLIWNITRTSRWSDGNAITLSAAAEVYNNVIWNTQHRGIWVDDDFVNRDAREVKIYHNTVFNSGLAGIEVATSGNPAYATIEANLGVNLPGNLMPDESWFVDPANGDFRLTNSASAIDAGTSNLVEFDQQGYARPQGSAADFGAYEFGSPDLDPLAAGADNR